MHATETRTQPASRHSRIPSMPGLLTAIAGLACVPAALAQYTFTGRVAAPPNSPRNWFDIGTDNTPCGVTPFGTIQYNNWGQEWCSQSPPSNLIPPNGTFNLAGFDIVAFNDTRASLVTNPGGGRFRTGNGTHSWGVLNNSGVVDNRRGAIGSTAIFSTTINNNGQWLEAAGSTGTTFANVTFNNAGDVSESIGDGIAWGSGTVAGVSGPNTLNNTGTFRHVGSGGTINGFRVVNQGIIRTETAALGVLRFSSCDITAGGQWITDPGATGAVDINGTTTLRGTFAGTTSHYLGLQMHDVVLIDGNTVFNIGGQGICRAICNSITIVPNATLTNSGVFTTFNGSVFSGVILNTGLWYDYGSTVLTNCTITNTGTITRTNGGDFSAGPGSLFSDIDNQGLFEMDENAIDEYCTGIGFRNNGTVRNRSAHGSMVFRGGHVESTANARWNAQGSPNGIHGFNFEDEILWGPFIGDAGSVKDFRMTGVLFCPYDIVFDIGGAGAVRESSSHMTVAPGHTFTNRNLFTTNNGARMTGDYINDGVWFDDGDWAFDDCLFTNNSSLVLYGSFSPYLNSPRSIFINNGSVTIPLTGGSPAINAINFANNGTITNPSPTKTLNLSGTNITSTPAARWNVTNPGGSAGFNMSNVTLRGSYTGATTQNNSWRINDSITIADDTTFNISGEGLTRWVASTCNIASGKTLRNVGVMNHLNGWDMTGNLVNDGVFNFYSGGITFRNLFFTNNGTINWYDHVFGAAAGAVFTNNGTVNIVPNERATVNTQVINNGRITIEEHASFGSDFMPLSQGSTGVIHLNQEPSALGLPSNFTLSGGRIEGSGIISGANNGPVVFDDVTLAPGNFTPPIGGRLIVPGSATLTSRTITRPSIYGPNGQSSNIASNNTLTLNGALVVDFGSFYPALGQSWVIATAASRVGTFSSVSYIGGRQGMTLSVSYTSTTATVTVTNPGCIADFDDGSGTGTRDGGVGIEDLLFYLSLYTNGLAAADVDNGSGTGITDGGVGIEDLIFYLQRFGNGC